MNVLVKTRSKKQSFSQKRWPHIALEETIQGGKLFKGGNYKLLRGFDCGNYSKEETIQGRKLYEEIRYLFL